jgi:predicted nucleic acid-binding protein
VPVFVDTNVLVYARDTSDPKKQATQRRGWSIWRKCRGPLSVKALQETR